jgi:hypothetical protein
LLQGKISNNKEALFFTFQNGHIPKHAADIIKDYKKGGILDYDGKSPCITYDQVVKNKRVVDFKLK